MANLTSKQEAFVREYAIDKNATQAAIRDGYSKKTAYSIGQENLKKPETAAALAESQESHAERCNVTVDSFTKELETDRERARGNNQSSAAISATMGMAKLHGKLTNEVEHSGAVDLTLID